MSGTLELFVECPSCGVKGLARELLTEWDQNKFDVGGYGFKCCGARSDLITAKNWLEEVSTESATADDSQKVEP